MFYLTLGLMKAGKSKTLIQHYRLYENVDGFAKEEEKLKVGVFSYKPYEESKFVEVSTRANGIEPILNVLNLSKIHLKQDLLNVLSNYDLILIDEIQFAPIEHLSVLIELSEDKDVACYGLSKDFQGNLFKTVKQLILLKEGLVFRHLEAACEVCGEEAHYNIRITDEKELFVTDKESYKTVCTKCKEEIES